VHESKKNAMISVLLLCVVFFPQLFQQRSENYKNQIYALIHQIESMSPESVCVCNNTLPFKFMSTLKVFENRKKLKEFS
jgi:hypothetical protein